MELIYVIEDDDNIRDLIKIALEGFGYEVSAFEMAEEALKHIESDKPSLAVFDLMLPGMDGLTAIRRIRKKESLKDIPVLILTAKDREFDKVAGLDGGADDYMTKPFIPEELLARIRALSRRQGEVIVEEMKFGDLSLNLSANDLCSGLKSIHLGYKEFEILKILMSNSGRIVSKETLISRVWGSDSDAEDNNVEAYISFLRKKLKFVGSRVEISTVRKVGYRLEERL